MNEPAAIAWSEDDHPAELRDKAVLADKIAAQLEAEAVRFRDLAKNLHEKVDALGGPF